MVTIRDGSYSKFDRSSVVDEFAPAQGLKAFLSRYVEDSISAKLLAEDDNPPSPMSPMPPGLCGILKMKESPKVFKVPIT